MLLDPSFLIDLKNGDEAAVEKARELETDLVQQRLSSMTLFELYYGVARATDSDRTISLSVPPSVTSGGIAVFTTCVAYG